MANEKVEQFDHAMCEDFMIIISRIQALIKKEYKNNISSEVSKEISMTYYGQDIKVRLSRNKKEIVFKVILR